MTPKDRPFPAYPAFAPDARPQVPLYIDDETSPIAAGADILYAGLIGFTVGLLEGGAETVQNSLRQSRT